MITSKEDGFAKALLVLAYAALVVGLVQKRWIDGPTIYVVLATAVTVFYQLSTRTTRLIQGGALAAGLPAGADALWTLWKDSPAADEVWHLLVAAATFIGAMVLVFSLPPGGQGQAGPKSTPPTSP